MKPDGAERELEGPSRGSGRTDPWADADRFDAGSTPSARDLTRDVWDVDPAGFPADADVAERARFLLNYAVLAPSSHNSQPWTFAVDDDTVTVGAATGRWLRVADPDRRELYLSLGCAIENLVVAARRFGFEPTVAYHLDGTPDRIATVTLAAASGDPTEADAALCEAITDRRTAHGHFESRPIAAAALDRLRARVDDVRDGEGGREVELVTITDPFAKRAIAGLQATADRRQMADRAYRAELGRWIGSGALGASRFGAAIGKLVVTHFDLGAREGRKNRRLVEEAPAIGLLVGRSGGRADQLDAGRAFERLSLEATHRGVAVHPLSQVLERPELSDYLVAILELEDAVPFHLFRLGYAEASPTHTPRWPADGVTSTR